jgi:sugar lactone lactonase YvrE
MMVWRTVAINLLLVVCGSLTAAAQDMPLSDLLIPGEDWQLVADGFKFTEGPATSSDGTLYFTDTLENKIFKVAPDGKLSTYVGDSLRTYGLFFGPGDKLYGCRNGTKEIVTFDPRGEATVVASEVMSNDLVVTREGTVYFTDPDNKQVWRVDAKGNKAVVDTGIERPNGIILWPDQKTLVVADTAGRHVWTFRIEPDGGLAFKQPYYTMQVDPGRSGSGADGMTVDSKGRIYVCTHVGLQVFDTQGRLSGVIAKPQPGKFLSNVAFGGPQYDMLYVTNTDRVYRRKVAATGVRMTQ